MTKQSSQLLAAYKHKTGLDNIRLAKLFSVDRKSITKYLKGENIHPKVAKWIEQVTNGQLKFADLILHKPEKIDKKP